MDHGLATNDWLIKFSGTRIHHLSSDSSNHCPLCIVLDSLEVAIATIPFHFKELWLSDPGCSNVVEAVWSSSDNANLLVKIMRKIERCGKDVVEAEKKAMKFGMNHRIKELKREITAD